MIVQVLADEGVSTIFGYSGGAILPTYDAVFCYNEARKEGRIADAADRARQRAGRGLHGGGLCARQRPRRRGHRHVGSGRHQHRHADPRLHGGLDSDRRDLRPGADAAPSAPTHSRKRRCPRSWARSRNTSSSSPIPTSSKPRCAPRSRSRAPAGRARWSSTFRRTCRTGRGEFQGSGTLPMPGYRKRLETLTTDIIDGTEANHFFEMLGESQRPLIYAGGGVINGDASAELREFARDVRHPGGHHADGHRRGRHHRARCRCACSACTARRSPTTRSTTATS